MIFMQPQINSSDLISPKTKAQPRCDEDLSFDLARYERRRRTKWEWVYERSLGM